jgi:prepilin-type N-terminal cleavage/methylation domain-containing protein
MAKALELSPSRRPDVSRSRLREEGGFTLVEVLVASIVLTVALVALAELLAVSVRMHQLGRNSATAARLAQDKFEELMKMNFNTAPAIQINANDTLGADVANYFDVPANSGYRRRWRVQAGPGGNAALRTVTVRLVADVRVGADFEVTAVLRSW